MREKPIKEKKKKNDRTMENKSVNKDKVHGGKTADKVDEPQRTNLLGESAFDSAIAD